MNSRTRLRGAECVQFRMTR